MRVRFWTTLGKTSVCGKCAKIVRHDRKTIAEDKTGPAKHPCAECNRYTRLARLSVWHVHGELTHLCPRCMRKIRKLKKGRRRWLRLF